MSAIKEIWQTRGGDDGASHLPGIEVSGVRMVRLESDLTVELDA